MEVIRTIVDEAYPEHSIKFAVYYTISCEKILVFGKAPEVDLYGYELVYTYSIAQIMSKANAASVLTAGIRQFLTEPDPIPFERPMGGSAYRHMILELDPELPVAIDIETDGLLGKTHTPEEVNVLSIAFYQPGMPPLVLTGEQKGEFVFPLKRDDPIARTLTKFKYGIYHNGKFDTRVLNRYFGIELKNSFDTMLAHHVLNHAAGDHKLKTAARRYLGAPEWEADLDKYTKGGGHYELIPQKLLIEYNGWDVYWTYKLWEFLKPQIEADEDNMNAFQFEMAAAEMLLKVEQHGIPFNEDYSYFYEGLLMGNMARVQSLLDKVAFPGFNPNSPKQVMSTLNSYAVYPVKTDEPTLMKLLEKPEELHENCVRFINLVLEYRGYSKKKSTYAVGWRNQMRNGRVHATYLVHGTSTGRLSSTGPNVQNLPREKEVRKIVRVRGE